MTQSAASEALSSSSAGAGAPAASSGRLPRVGSQREFDLRLADGRTIRVRADADWVTLRRNEKPIAEMFFVHYAVDGAGPSARGSSGAAPGSPRPVTFVFNGGPGASSAYLHAGALGPKRVRFAEDGTVLPPPAQLVDNDRSWLACTDLVFVDPVGTGFSRTVDEAEGKSGSQGKGEGGAPKGEGGPSDAKENPEFFRVGRDLEAIGEFIQRFLSKNALWSRPVYVAGESYGGFRVGKLARRLQEKHGVALSGAILISPALELDLLFKATDYDAMSWVDLLPSFAAAAVHHGRSRAFKKGADPATFLPEAEAFAVSDYARWLAAGDALGADERSRILRKTADYMGLSESFVEARGGRVSFVDFSRELLRDRRRIAGLYDASSTAIDPFPDRSPADAPDPTLVGIEPTFAAGINVHLRETLGVQTELDYRLLSFDVFRSWKLDTDVYSAQAPMGATDDLRYGMALNPHMRVWIVHGIYDLVTPYFATRRIAGLMKLLPEQAERLKVESFKGGHMFYAWDESRARFAEAAAEFYGSARR